MHIREREGEAKLKIQPPIPAMRGVEASRGVDTTKAGI
jgi:hypothetical protein